MRRTVSALVVVAGLLALLGSAVAGVMLGGVALHPMVRPLSPDLVQHSYQIFQRLDATVEEIVVQAPDGVSLRGWKVHPAQASNQWVLLFHGQSDNRAGMLGQAEVLLRHNYGVIMMDSRAHGASGGAMATYGWLEKRDTQAIIDALYAR